MVGDDIPNIRFNVAKSYAVLIGVLRRLPDTGTIMDLEKQNKSNGISNGESKGSGKGGDLVQKKILPNLERLQGDEDVDVRYFATTATQAWEEEMQMAT